MVLQKNATNKKLGERNVYRMGLIRHDSLIARNVTGQNGRKKEKQWNTDIAEYQADCRTEIS